MKQAAETSSSAGIGILSIVIAYLFYVLLWGDGLVFTVDGKAHHVMLDEAGDEYEQQ